MKITPGQWSEPCTYGASKFEIHTTGGVGKQIAIVNTLADARLISAAPDLLAALERIAGLRKRADDCVGMVDNPHAKALNAAVAAASEAIASTREA